MVKKSKSSTYILLMLVLAIWGIVGYRIIEARKGSSFTPPASFSEKGAKPDSACKLSLCYRDPFLNTPVLAQQPAKRVAIHPKPIQIGRPPQVSYASLLARVRGTITYNGLIANRSKNGLMGIAQANGVILYVRNQSYVDSLIVTHICKDSLVLKGRYTYVIRKIQ